MPQDLDLPPAPATSTWCGALMGPIAPATWRSLSAGAISIVTALAAFAERLVVGVPAVEKNISAIFAKLGLEPAPDNHRRVLAVLRYLDSTL